MLTNIVMLTGKAQSGKSTSCEFLQKCLRFYGYSCEIYNFADPLKQFCVDVLGLERSSVYGTNEEKNAPTHISWRDLPHMNEADNTNPLTGRQILQFFGTDICRRMYNDCWAYATFSQIYKDNPQFALIADTRFPNEVQAGLLLNRFSKFQDRIYDRPYIVKLLRNPLNLQHISETALDNFNYSGYDLTIIDNVDMPQEHKDIELMHVCKLLRKRVNAQH